MKSTFIRFICRVLTASMIILPWQAQAGLIGADQVLNAAQQRAAHATVAGFINRDEVAAQLQLLGLPPQAAKERVAALTDAEVAGLACRIDALPAGGASPLPAIVFLILFYFFIIAPPATAKESPKVPAKPAPAPEKK
jgi:hypothetical protein